MEIWLELKQKNYLLSKAEAENKLGKIIQENKPLVKIKTNKQIQNLALTKKAWQKIDLKKINTKTFKIDNKPEIITKYAKKIQEKTKAKIKLDNPETTLKIIEGDIHKLIYKEDKNINKRKAHQKPYQKPTSIDPQLARAMINLTNAKEITDPFCGSGGILIEANIIGIKAKGIDIDQKSLEMAKKNAEHYNLNIELEKADSTKKKITTEAIVTDLPYGRSSKKTNTIQELINETLKHDTKKAIICIPKQEKITIPKPWTLKQSFEEYIHKSLTRKILDLEIR